jgi:hypothetical protein
MEVVTKDLETMPASLQEIKLFLTTFKKQAKANGLIYYNWEENLQELLFLEITARRREQIILRLSPEDYVEGPYEHDHKEEIDCWRFQVEVKEKQVQIEISLADDLGAACCYVFAAV